MPDRGLPRVLFVIGSLEPGGSEGQMVMLLERAHGVRFQAAVAALAPAEDLRHTRTLAEHGIPLTVLGEPGTSRPARLVGSARKLRALIRSFRPDIAYPWLEQSALLTAPIATALRVPMIVARRNVHGPYAERAQVVVRAMHTAERRAVLATANSRAVADETVRRGVPRERVRIVLNGHPALEHTPLPSGPTVTMGYVARLREEKGHGRLVETLARLHTATPWRMDLAGDGPLRERLETEVAERGLRERVDFLGAVTDVAGFWREREVAVLLSDYEGSPNALIEAAMAGRPAVATDVGGVPDVVAPDGGLLVDPADPSAGAEALARLIDDRALRERLGEGARRQAVERFSVDTFVEGHCEAIDEAIMLGAR